MTNKVPNIRFKGFTDDWEQRKVEGYASFLTGSGLSWDDISEDGEQECILYGNLYTDYGMITDKIVYKTNTKVNKPVYSKFGDVLIPASDTTPTGLARATSLEKSDVLLGGDINIIRPNEDINGSCLSLALNANKKELIRLIKGTTVRHIHNSDIKGIELSMSKSKAEQTMIAEYFKSLDHIITLHQRKCEQTKELKKFMLQKMFPKKGEKNPEIRFPGFTDDWEQRKFGELYEKVSRKNDMTYGTEQIISVANMYYKVDANVKRQDYLKTYNIFELGDIAFEGNKSKHFAHGRFVENTIGNGIVSHVFDVFKPIMDFNLSFWKYYINYEGVMGPILTRVTKASTMMTNLVAKDFLNEDILVPSIAEQQKIGEYLSNLDHLITLHQRKCEQLKELKKFMLQNMFPKKG
ncbi:restriction endonuclease subunit S [Streptococcus lutetiensis]|uniref:restriction endonuclease subunit S n=1 Tax=Streptococcus lutetiensis TaxID=150055 RepID=UPI0022839A72|nr:restriction endonuclease subunit S [Streptococcus lutetiensis]MCY7161377.1 restriction endonuclease subunit S [Streptococcus lutetiensis]